VTGTNRVQNRETDGTYRPVSGLRDTDRVGGFFIDDTATGRGMLRGVTHPLGNRPRE
jgi:hypothetical protein